MIENDVPYTFKNEDGMPVAEYMVLDKDEFVRKVGDEKWIPAIVLNGKMNKKSNMAVLLEVFGTDEALIQFKKVMLDYKNKKADEPLTSASPGVHNKAMEILKHGDPIKFVVDSCGKVVLGAEDAFTKLVCCISVQNIKQTNGLHPKLGGKSGGGKTYIIVTFVHRLPEEMVNMGSMSAKAAFYHGYEARTVNIQDDYRDGGNPDMDTVIKQTSSVYHETYFHKTVSDGKPMTLEVGSEQTWVITSVDASQDIQVLNRQLLINVDDSEEMTKLVNKKTIERYGKGVVVLDETEDVLVCREIFRILRNEDYINVRIPFYDRIEWLDDTNRRNISLFMDVLDGITGMFRYQRETDADGYYLATEEDYERARELFTDKDAEEMILRLSRSEQKFARVLMEHPGGMSRADVASVLGVSVNRVTALAKSMSDKLIGFDEEDRTETFDHADYHKTSTRIRWYKLSNYSELNNFGAVVRLTA
jgi:hypothetical protein